MDEGEVPHVEEVLDRAEPRHADGDRPSGREDAIFLVTLGEVDDVAGGLSERRKDVAVSDAGGEKGVRIAPDDPHLTGPGLTAVPRLAAAAEPLKVGIVYVSPISEPVTGNGYDRSEGITSQSRYTLFRPSDCPDNPDHLRWRPEHESGRTAGDDDGRPGPDPGHPRPYPSTST